MPRLPTQWYRTRTSSSIERIIERLRLPSQPTTMCVLCTRLYRAGRPHESTLRPRLDKGLSIFSYRLHPPWIPLSCSRSALTSARPTRSSPTLRSRTQIHTSRPAARRTSSHTSLRSLLDGQLLGDRGEQLLHILRRLGARLEEEQVGFFGVGFGVGGGDGALVGLFGDEIEFVACERDDDVVVCLALELFHPRLGFV